MKLRSVGLFVLISIFSLSSCKYDGATREEPSWVRATFKNDPATSVVIGWHKGDGRERADRFYYDTVDHGTDYRSYAYSQSPDAVTDYFGIESAFVELKDLEPDTKYYFVIKNSYGVSKRYYVQTLPDRNDVRLSIISGGDSRNNRTPRRAANTLVRKLKPHFVAFGGDMTDFGTGNQWAGWFEDWELTHGEDGRVTPIVVARGNHERSNKVLAKLFWAHTDNYFALGIADNLLRMYTLNSEMSAGGDQLTWLKSDLADNDDFKWKFAQYHRPMRPHAKKKKDNTAAYQNWANLFYEHNVNLVMESDAHLVKSTWPIRPSTDADNEEGFIRDDKNGTVYVGEGCWGAPLRGADDNKSWTRDSDSFNQFKWIFVDYDAVEIRTIKVDNANEVHELDIENRFEIPANLDLWNPSQGEVITLQ